MECKINVNHVGTTARFVDLCLIRTYFMERVENNTALKVKPAPHMDELYFKKFFAINDKIIVLQAHIDQD